MKNRFFIMMSSQNGDYVLPIVDDDEEVMLFETEEDARRCGDDHSFCQAFGYEVFERGAGL